MKKVKSKIFPCFSEITYEYENHFNNPFSGYIDPENAYGMQKIIQ
jgi:hypothetical protein